MPHLHTCTLFPYTTLFRSKRPATEKARSEIWHSVCGSLRPATSVGLDRKSTRLNSSHQIISYAVFCLKKKRLGDRPAGVQATLVTQAASQCGRSAQAPGRS